MAEEFAYPIEEVAEEEDVDWQVVDFDAGREQRVVKLTVAKKPIAQGVKMWWKRAFKGGPEIDLAAIQGRSMNKHRCTSAAARFSRFSCLGLFPTFPLYCIIARRVPDIHTAQLQWVPRTVERGGGNVQAESQSDEAHVHRCRGRRLWIRVGLTCPIY